MMMARIVNMASVRPKTFLLSFFLVKVSLNILAVLSFNMYSFPLSRFRVRVCVFVCVCFLLETDNIRSLLKGT